MIKLAKKINLSGYTQWSGALAALFVLAAIANPYPVSAQVPPRLGVVEQRGEKKPRKDWSAAEVYVGPSYLRLEGEDLAGVQVAVAVNRWRYFSLVGTFGYHGGNQRTIRFDRPAHHPPGRCDDEPPHVSDHDSDHDNACQIPKPKTVFSSTGVGNVYTYLGGLRVRRNLVGRLAGFAQAQVGGVRVSRQNGLAVAAGGGLQLSLSQRFALEGRVEYLPLRLAGEWTSNNLQATVGLVVWFGPWWGGFRKP